MIARMMDNITAAYVNAELQGAEIDTVVQGLRHSRDVLHNVRYRGPVRPPPSREEIVATLGEFARALFPAHYGRPELLDRGEHTPESIDDYVGVVLRRALAALNDQVRRTLPFTSDTVLSDAELHDQALAIVRRFAAGLPAIRGLLVSDLRAAYAGDPAATGYP
jgi:serine O-acetyltransferase